MKKHSSFFQFVFIEDFYDAKAGYNHHQTFVSAEQAYEFQQNSYFGLTWQKKGGDWVEIPDNVVTLCHVISEKTFTPIEPCEGWEKLKDNGAGTD